MSDIVLGVNKSAASHGPRILSAGSHLMATDLFVFCVSLLLCWFHCEEFLFIYVFSSYCCGVLKYYQNAIN
ncbi:hypothetical protein POPTR_001G239700v4 [Populus trichocarpa]|jgi:hypothetical protein|uniref:Uncharacterized protein n=1 Tax=Populus trichocarpa TaxID=3694 RepID=A0A2K2C2Q6_POPTR|nr:hypothetical protein POPTR_001G239700v4 [Populus trichocarpa]